MRFLNKKMVLALAIVTAGSLSFAQGGGEAIYKAKCQMCHGATGGADTPAGKAMNTKSFSDPILMKRSDASILTVLRSGAGKMPAYKDKLTESQLQDLVEYIHHLQKK